MSERSALSQLSDVAERHRLRPGRQAGRRVILVPLADIDFDSDQPRTEFTGEVSAETKRRLHELAQSVLAIGIEEPLHIRSHPELSGRYLLVTGERRLRASQIAGLQKVPCLVDEETKTPDRMRILLRQLTENNQREPLSLLDEARAVHRLVYEHGCSRSEVQELLGRSKTWISNRLRLIDKSDRTSLQALDEGLLTDVETCRLFGKLPERKRERFLKAAREERAPISQVAVARALKPRHTEKPPPATRPETREPSRHAPEPAPTGPAPLTLALKPEAIAYLLRKLGEEPSEDNEALPQQLYDALETLIGAGNQGGLG